jgi:hypothetical protein
MTYLNRWLDEYVPRSCTHSSRFGVSQHDQSVTNTPKIRIFRRYLYLQKISPKSYIRLALAFTGIETRNKYHIKNNLGQHIYYAREESDWFTRNYCGPTRPFHLRIFDSHKHEVIHLYRPLAGDNYNYSCSVQV